MNKVSRLKTVLFVSASMLAFTMFQSCIEKDISQITPDPVQEESGFDFSMKKDITVDIDYGFSSSLGGNNYQVIFEIYKEIPYTYDKSGNRTKKASVYPIYSAWTDGAGRFKKDIILPSALKEVYLLSSFIGTVNMVKLPIENNQLTFDQKAYIANLTKSPQGLTKAENTWTLPGTKWATLGNWDASGTPDYMIEDKAFTESFLNDMKTMFAGLKDDGGIDIWNREKDFFIAQNGKSTDMDIHIIKSTRVSMSTIRTVADLKSSIGYYVYKTDAKPTKVSDISRFYIAFPHLSSTSPITTGKQVRLLFPGENGLTENFPAGYSIGFFMIVNGFESGNIGNGYDICYSTIALNTPSAANDSVKGQRTVALFEPGTNQMIALGFEDLPTWDKDYNDALLNIFIEQPNAIKTEEMPNLEDTTPTPGTPNSDPQAISVYEGMMLFEDLWPSQGDYDMNDVMISYHSTVYRDKSNSISKTEDIFTPTWNGASYTNGFGFQYGSGQPTSIRIDNGVHPASTYMQGRTSEPGQSKTTIVLFDNITTAVKNEPIKITTEFAAGSATNLVPPYNSFVIVHTNQALNARTEVHLINQKPTDKASDLGFGEKDDASNPSLGRYYVSSLKYPFSLDIPKLDFRIINEAKKIYDAYPQYSTWVESNGEQATNWYESPNESLVH